MKRYLFAASITSVLVLSQSACGAPKYPAFETTLDETPGVIYEFAAADATNSSPVFMSIRGRVPTSNDRQYRTLLIRSWVAAHAPKGATMVHWASAKCGLKREDEFSGCDIFAVKDPVSGEEIEYYFYAGNWPFRE